MGEMDGTTIYFLSFLIIMGVAWLISFAVLSATNAHEFRCPNCTQPIITTGEIKDVSCPMCGTKIVEDGAFVTQVVKSSE